MHSFIQHLPNIYYVLATAPGADYIAVNKKTTSHPCLDSQQLTTHMAWHMVTQEKHKAGWEEREGSAGGTGRDLKEVRWEPCGGLGEEGSSAEP